MKTLARIGGWLAPYRGQMILALVLTTLACLCNLPVPLLVQALVDRVVTQGHWGALPLYASLLFGVFAVQAGLALVNGLVVGRIGQGVVRDLRHRLYDRLQQLGLAYYDKTPSGAIISRVMDDVGAIQVFVTGQTFTILTDLGTTLAISALLLARDWRLAAVVAGRRAAVRAQLPLLHAADPRDQHGDPREDGPDLRPPEGQARRDARDQGVRAGAGGDRRLRRAARRCARAPGAGEPAGRGVLEPQRRDRRRGHGAGVRGRGVRGAPGADDARRGRLDGGAGRDGLRAGGAAGRPGVRLRADGRQRRPAGRDPRPRARRRRAEPAEVRALPGPAAGPAGPSSSTGSASATGRGEPVVWDIRLEVEPG